MIYSFAGAAVVIAALDLYTAGANVVAIDLNFYTGADVTNGDLYLYITMTVSKSQ